MPGVLLDNGQAHMVDVTFKAAEKQNYYLGLIQETENPALDAQVGTGITEVTGTGYARVELTSWTGTGAVVTSEEVTFTIGTGGWDSVNGYMICLSEDGDDAIMAEAFPAERQGNKAEGDQIKITAQYEQRCSTEA